MNDPRWNRIEDLFQRAVDLAPAQRVAFLSDFCEGDENLRREVESLLAHEQDNVLRRAVERAADRADNHMSLSVGTKLGPYEILAPIGAGGMGEVYRARDPRLDRDVAIKVSQERFSDRFGREARAVAALNHPNICTLHDVGPNYLVMEFVEGETLAARLRRGALKMDQALALAIQITSALAEAHGKGVVHRDLKPGNIMIGKSGVKVLDFGLAKIEQPATDQQQTDTMTAEGAILGTVQYMSPEQAQGKEVDARSDIFSFGLVLYEMITGKRAFEGSNPASTIAAILEREAPSLEPEGLNRVVRACLAKDPADRFQTARDLKRALEWSVSGNGEAGALSPRGARRRRLAWSVGAVATLGLTSVALLRFSEKPPITAAPVRFQIQGPENATLGALLKLSPDGRKLAFITGGRLWVHFLESGESRNLARAGGMPFWSPDSRFIAYPSSGTASGKLELKKIEANGGPSLTVTEYRGLWGGGAWNQRDLIVFSLRTGLFRVPASGGVPVQITALDPARQEALQYSPFFLPDGQHFVYTRRSRNEGKSAIYLGSVDAKPEQQSLRPLVNSFWGSEYSPSADPGMGYLLFVREGTLIAQSFDNRKLELAGQPVAVAEQVSDGRAFSVSANNVLVFHRSVIDRQLAWYDREGKEVGKIGDSVNFQDLALSPGGKRLAVTEWSGEEAASIWLLDLSRGGAGTRFTSGSAMDAGPVWSPDGSRIIFSSNRDGPYNLYQKLANGGKDEEVLLKSSEHELATSWSRDGRFLLYQVINPTTKNDLWVLPMEGDRKPVPFLITEVNERHGQFSPDGHWVAYTSNESGQDEIYVRSFSMNSAGTAVEAGGKWPISNGPGVEPRWRGDGRELYYRTRGGQLMAVEISTNPGFRAGNPQPLGVLTFASADLYEDWGWDAAADGKRFVGSTIKSAPQPYTVVVNWQAGLKK